jgi:hypothetical protein
MRAQPHDFDAPFVRHLTDDRDHLGRADVQADDEIAVILSRHLFFYSKFPGCER